MLLGFIVTTKIIILLDTLQINISVFIVYIKIIIKIRWMKIYNNSSLETCKVNHLLSDYVKEWL